MKKDEEKEIKVTLPKEFTKPELSGKKVVIKVKLFEIKKKVLPEINDEFAKQVGPFANLEELKKKIREEIGAYYKQLVEKDTISQIEDFLLKNTKIDVPDSVVDSFHDMIYEENVSYLKNSGKATDEHIKEKEKDLKESARRDAVSQVKLMYIINGIAEKENVQVGDEEINAQVLTTANRTGKTPEEIRGYLTKNDKWWDFAYRMRNDKLTKLLQEKADVTEVELKPEESKIK
jgi:trigger factor